MKGAHRQGRGSAIRRVAVSVVAALAVFGAVMYAWGAMVPEQVPHRGDESLQREIASPVEQLTWAPPDTSGFRRVRVSEPGTVRMDDNTDYVIVAPERIDGPVVLRGGRNVVWVGGHIRISDQGSGAAPIDRRALVIQDGQTPVEGRVVHVEGLLVDGSDLSEGINTNAPSAIVQIQNCRIVGVHYRSLDDLEGKGEFDAPNHPDIVQTWGSVGELRIDALTGSSAYQGLFLKADQNRPHGPVWLRRVDLTATAYESETGQTFYGHRLLFWDPKGTGTLHIDEGTVFIDHQRRSQWGPGLGDNVHPPVSADETLAARTGSSDHGAFVTWPMEAEAQGEPAVRNFTGNGPGRVYGGDPQEGSWVPEGVAGLGYQSPGYARDQDARS